MKERWRDCAENETQKVRRIGIMRNVSSLPHDRKQDPHVCVHKTHTHTHAHTARCGVSVFRRVLAGHVGFPSASFFCFSSTLSLSLSSSSLHFSSSLDLAYVKGHNDDTASNTRIAQRERERADKKFFLVLSSSFSLCPYHSLCLPSLIHTHTHALFAFAIASPPLKSSLCEFTPVTFCSLAFSLLSLSPAFSLLFSCSTALLTLTLHTVAARCLPFFFSVMPWTMAPRLPASVSRSPTLFPPPARLFFSASAPVR